MVARILARSRAAYGWVYELATMQGGAASVMLPINEPFRRVEADE